MKSGKIKTAGKEDLTVRGSAIITIDLDEDVNIILPVAIVEGLSKKLIMGIDVMDKINATINVSKKKITFMDKYTFEIATMPLELLHIEECNSYYFKNNN
jgi:hypothetical protein